MEGHWVLKMKFLNARGVRGKKESRLGEGEVGQGLWEGRTLSANVKEPSS